MPFPLNRAGAATTLASGLVAKSAPDGYTLYLPGPSGLRGLTPNEQRFLTPFVPSRGSVVDLVGVHWRFGRR